MAPKRASGCDTRKVDTNLQGLRPVRCSLKPWQSVALHQKEQRIKSYHKHLAMYTVIMPGHEISSAALYSFTQGITLSCELKLNLPAAMNYFRSCSSSHGWLSYPDDYREVVTLLNPVTYGTYHSTSTCH